VQIAETITNARFAELLAVEAEGAAHQIQHALRKASRSAFLWLEEAATLVKQKRPLTELAGVGPYLEKIIRQWIVKPPLVPEPDAIRQNFFTWPQAQAILATRPD
jgi:hypothetical protein